MVDNWNNKCQSHNAGRLGRTGCLPENLGVYNLDNDIVDAGNNDANNNTGGGDVMAGWASLLKNLMTHINDNLVVVGQ